MSKVRHVLGISGGKDSAALAIYMKQKFPNVEMEYYTCDTGKELEETYRLIDALEGYLGKKIIRLTATKDSPEDPFDHYLKMYGGFLPSSNARWCTKVLKLVPFEQFVGNDPVISYVGIRGDEDREGYISKKSNIQSIFPFRRNIWSEDVIRKILSNANLDTLSELYSRHLNMIEDNHLIEVAIKTPLSLTFTQVQKLDFLLSKNVKVFNWVVFDFLKTTGYPLSQEENFSLINKDEVLVRDDIFRILEESGVGVPEYYKKVDFEVKGKTGQYSRSRSGCYFCFFQQKIEWIWLYEQHPERFAKAMEYEKDGYTWCQDEMLSELIQPERMQRIKEEYLKKVQKGEQSKSPFLLDILTEAEGEGCAACFI
jgi:3'-phosphoadenosine 5'-phosphosulfate sulfotransferase (PAPS reductase)/FAD synthetase